MAELVLGCFWTVPLLDARAEGLGILLVFVWIYGIQALLMVAGACFYWKRPEARRLARVVMLLPIALLFLPFLLRNLLGPIEGEAALGTALLVAVGAAFLSCLLFPRWMADLVPRFLLSSRPLNVGVLLLQLALIGSWVALALVVLGKLAEDESGILLGAFFAAAGAGALVSLAVFLYSYLGFFQTHDTRQRPLRVAQLVLSLPVPLLFVMLSLAVGIQPG